MKFKISDRMLDTFPDILEYIVVARGINNEIAGKWVNDRIEKVMEDIRGQGQGILDETRYLKWIEIYQKAAEMSGIEPKNFSPSHVALIRRILDGKSIPNISPVVNFYNLYSLEYGISVGGEDLKRVYGDLELGLSEGGEKFVEISGNAVDNLGRNEVIWKDDHSVTCRMWAWRQSERTKLSKSTTDMYFIFDGLKNTEDVDLDAVVKKFTDELGTHFGGSIEVGVLDARQPVFEVDYKTKAISGSDVKVEEDLRNLVSKAGKKKSKKVKKFMKRKAKSMGFADKQQLRSRLTAVFNEVIAEAGYGEDSERQVIHQILLQTMLQIPQNTKFGDFSSTVALRLAKQLKKPPKEIAEEIVDILKKDQSISDIFAEISVAPNGFINLKTSESFLLSELISALGKGTKYGQSSVGKDKVILVESPAINPNSAAHVGHLLNLFIGRALVRLFKKTGFNVEIDNLINDKDNKVCMALWGYLKYGEGKTPESEGVKADHFVGKFYVIGRKAYKDGGKSKKEIEKLLVDLEEGDPEVTKEWQKLVDWAFAGHDKTFERLNEEKGYLWFESDLWEGGVKIIKEYLGKGVIEELPDGAIIGRIEEKYGLPDVVLMRSDGTSLYHTQDVYLTLQKIKKFNPWQAIWVVANEQILHFQRLFALLDNLGILSVDNLYHLAYGMVNDKNGKKISSREGEYEKTADGFLDMMHDAALKVMKERKVDVEVEDKDDVAEVVGIGALRYLFLSRDSFRDVTFDPELALSFSGRSGPYVMYAYTRGKSVLRKAGVNDEGYRGRLAELGTASSVEVTKMGMTKIDRKLILQLLNYPAVVLDSANNYAPSILADYLYEIASIFNNFYEKETISGAKGSEKDLRVAITDLTTRVLQDGLGILGIKVLERM